MTPDYLVSADGLRLTEKLQRYCTAIQIVDEAGSESDSASITLADTEGRLALPRMGAELTVALGYQETGLMPMGIYRVDNIMVQSSPRTLTIKGHAANLNSAFKSQQTRSWEPQALGNLIHTIASENGYEAKVSQALKNIPLPHIDQTAESDLHFLTRLASIHGAIAKPTNGYLVFAMQSAAQSISGMRLPTVTITPDQVKGWRITLSQRPEQGSVIAEHHDIDQADTLETTAGHQSPQHRLRQSFADPQSAKHAANSVLNQLAQSTATLAMTLIGNQKLRAESPIVLAGFALAGHIPTDWIVNRVEHQLSVSQGFVTRITAQAARIRDDQGKHHENEK
nr:phage late control protein [Coxiellaceae bacterium]